MRMYISPAFQPLHTQRADMRRWVCVSRGGALPGLLPCCRYPGLVSPLLPSGHRQPPCPPAREVGQGWSRRPSPSRASTTRASASCAPKPTRRPTKSHQERAPKPAYAGVWIEDCKPAHPCRTATVSLPTNQLPAWFPALCSRDESQMPSSAPHGPTHCRRGSHRTHPGGVPARKERGGRSDGEAPTHG